ncbi:hypothetical protein STSP_13850 [Streptomyces jeddahensis]|uniref:Secreted protein n=2 Tax=Streptomyces jeddahensis TaxID=1716141 RepID=A0A177HXE5_9ACTN|nr:hypothetical protein STSP_13850 [Streptomyces jeddahensis]
MTYPPNGGAAPPGPALPTMPAIPPQPGASPAPAGPSGSPPAVPARRTAWAEGVDRLRTAATTEPGRLRIIGAVLALLVVAFGAVTTWEMSERSAAADDVLHRSQPLSRDAADIYRSLADANTAASSGFLAGGQEPAGVVERYERDIRTASEKLATAATNSGSDPASAAAVAKLNKLLPEYTGLIERARANNRQGLPLGGAYLRYANDKMQTMLDAAEQLYKEENERLRADYDDATPYPWAAIGIGVLALAALVWAQRRNYHRTNRVFNHGLVAATAASAVVLLWLLVGHTMARAGLDDSYDHGVRSLNVLNDARIASLKARGNENLTLVSRGAETREVGGVPKDKFDVEYQSQMEQLGGAEGGTGLLGTAASLADDAAGRQPVAEAIKNVKDWKNRHQAARAADDSGDYETALEKVIGTKDQEPTDESFDQVDDALKTALDHEQTEFEAAAEHGRNAMTGLPVGAAVLAVLGAAAAVLGIGRRLSEYR